MTIHRPRNWPDTSATNTPSSAASFGFDIAAELARMNHPTARGFRGPHRFPTHDLDTDTECIAWKCAACSQWVSEGEPDRDDCPVDWLRSTIHPVRADLLARVLPFADESEVGIPADRRRHGDRSRPATAAAEAGAASNPHSAGVRRGLIALACCFAVGWLLGRRRT